MSEINEKIKKLLRLAKSDNEYEARLALARARKLMAEYKLDIKDFDDTNKKVIKKVTDMYFTGYKNTYRSLRTSGIKVNSSGSNNARIKGYTDGYNTKLNNQLNQSY